MANGTSAESRETGAYDQPEDDRLAMPAESVFERRKSRLVHAAAFSLPIAGAAIFIASLRATSMITLPLAIAAFLVILTWPVHSWLARRTHRVVAILGTLTILAVIVAGFAGLLYWALSGFVANLDSYAESLASFAKRQERSFPAIAGAFDPDPEQLRSMAKSTLRTFAVSASVLFLTTMFTVFAVSEAGRWRKRVVAVLDQRRPGMIDTLGDVTSRFRRYMWTRVVMSVLTGTGTFVTCWAFGVRDAPLWGVVAFLLNFIPNLGSLVAVIPPAVVALTQLGGGQALSVLAVLTAVQVTIGQWLEPMVQGKALKISPLVVLLSVVFWGWVWGIGGALLSVPMTVLFIALCERSQRWSWIAELISDTAVDTREEGRASSSDETAQPTDVLTPAEGLSQ
jgi:AI-2 transport protein TqsA